MSLIEHDFVASQWESALPVLMDYIAIPARSPMFDPAWSDTGHIARAASLLRDWAVANAVPGATIELVEVPGLTPVLFVEVPATVPFRLTMKWDVAPRVVFWSAVIRPAAPEVRPGSKLPPLATSR